MWDWVGWLVVGWDVLLVVGLVVGWDVLLVAGLVVGLDL